MTHLQDLPAWNWLATYYDMPYTQEALLAFNLAVDESLRAMISAQGSPPQLDPERLSQLNQVFACLDVERLSVEFSVSLMGLTHVIHPQLSNWEPCTVRLREICKRQGVRADRILGGRLRWG